MRQLRSLRGLVRRQLSTESAANVETAPKESAWRRDLRKFGKYLAVIVPGVVGAMVTTLVVNHKGVKEGIEYVFPAYIDLVRRNVGFGEEDLEGTESIRIRDETIASTQDVIVTLKYRNGSQVERLHFDDLKGLMLCSELMEIVRNRVAETTSAKSTESQNASNSDWEAFLANVDVSVDFATSSTADDGISPQEQSKKDPYSVKALMHRQREELMASLEASQSASCSVKSLSPSLWGENTVPSMGALRKRQKQLLYQSQSPSSLESGHSLSLIDTCKNILHVQFCNEIEYMREGILSYKALTRQDTILHALRSHYNSRGKYIEGLQHKRAKQSTADIKYSKEKAQASERVKELEGRVKRLNDELAAGTRPIDDVLEDLTKTKAEITRLKRTYINSMYFF